MTVVPDTRSSTARRTLKQRWLAVPFAAAVLVPMACTSDKNDSEASTTTAAASTTAAATTTSGTTPATGGKLTLGVLAPGPGLLDELFTAQTRALNFAVADVKAGNGELTLESAAVDPGKTELDVLPGLVGKGAKSIVGPAGSTSALAVQPELSKQGAVACSASATVTGLTANQDPGHMFRTVVSDSVMATELSDRIVAKRNTDAAGAAWKVAIVARGDDFGQTMANEVAAALTAQGLAPTVYPYNPLTVIFDDVAKQVSGAKPDLTLLISYEEGPNLLSALLKAGMSAKTMIGTDAFFIPRLAAIAGGGDAAKIDGFNLIGTTGDKAFIDRLIKDDANGQVAYAAQAYDCAVTLALAAAAVAKDASLDTFAAVQKVTAGGRTCSTYEDCISKLTAGEDIDYDGVSGKLSIGSTGDVGFARITTATMQGGAITNIQNEDLDLSLEQAKQDLVAATSFVTQLQLGLRLLGYYTGPIDGIYDDDVKAAVAAFQTAAGLEATGIYDEPTDEALRARLAAIGQTLSLNTTQVQQALTTLGYYTGPIDGIWTKELSDAIKKLQADLGVPQTGILDPPTIKAIYDKGFQSGSTTTTTTTTPSGSTTTTVPSTTTTVAATDLVAVLTKEGYTDFVTALQIAGVQAIDGNLYTVFAPSNDAIDETKLTPENADAVKALVGAHILPGSIPSGQLKAGSYTTVGGSAMTVTVAGGVITIDGTAKVVKPDLKASNGVVHGIDKVLPAPAVPA